MMRFSFLLICCLLWSLVGASSPNPVQNELRDLLTARSLADFETKEAEAVRRRSLSEACESELRQRLLPRSCFQRFAKSEASPDESRRLARICVENAKTSVSRLDLEASVESLPPDCQRASRERLEDLRYADDGVHPERSASRTLGPEIEMTSTR